MTDVLELAREVGLTDLMPYARAIDAHAALTAFRDRIRDEDAKEREAMAAVCKAAIAINESLAPVEFKKGQFAELRSAIEALQAMQDQADER
jgi:hypothetical protein